MKRSRRSIRNYYFRHMSLGFSAVLLLMVVFSSLSISTVLENKLKTNIDHNLQMMSYTLENELGSLEALTTQVSYRCLQENTLYNIITSDSYFTRQQCLELLDGFIRQVTGSNKHIKVVACLLTDAQSRVYSYPFLEADQAAMVFTQQDLQCDVSMLRFQAPHASVYDEAEPVVFSSRLDMNIGPVGYGVKISVYVESSLDLQRYLSDTGMSGRYSLLDAAGNAFYAGSGDGDEGESFTFSSRIDPYGMTIDYSIPRSEYYSERDAYYRNAFYVAIAGFLMIVLLIWKFTNALLRPVNYILKGVSRLGCPNLNGEARELQPYGYVEFDHLIAHINQTQKEIDGLIRELCAAEKQRSEIQTLFLRAQINPHFLYNSLNAIQWMARLDGSPEIDRYVESFINILRYNLDKDGILSTVENELRIVRTYMTLLAARYGDNVQVTLDVREETLDLPIPKFIIQPFVENAIYHGLPDQKGHIRLSVSLGERSELVITVEDDGRGMTPEQIERIVNLEHWKEGMGIGIRYVKEILHYTYGDRCLIEFLHASGPSGLLVRIIIREPLSGLAAETR